MDFNKALEFNPQYASAYAARAVAYTYLYMDNQAQADIEKAFELAVDRATLEEVIELAKSQR